MGFDRYRIGYRQMEFQSRTFLGWAGFGLGIGGKESDRMRYDDEIELKCETLRRFWFGRMDQLMGII